MKSRNKWPESVSQTVDQESLTCVLNQKTSGYMSGNPYTYTYQQQTTIGSQHLPNTATYVHQLQKIILTCGDVVPPLTPPYGKLQLTI